MSSYSACQRAAREKAYKEHAALANAFVRGIVTCSFAVGRTRSDAPISFKFEDCTVRNPFWSIRGEDMAVDPWGYYGREFCESDFVTEALEFLEKRVKTAPKCTQPNTIYNVYIVQ